MRRNIFLISRFSLVLLFSVLLVFSGPAGGQSADKIGPLIEKMTWRAIGPALMGGRTVDIEAVERTPWVIYAAVGPSGVWKSENNGVTWSPVFYKESSVSVGDIAVSQSHPDIIWAGTGEATCRNSVTIGDGIYKSSDGGKTWTNMGLKDTRHISRIVINRGDPNIVYAAAMGHLWGPNAERGLYKTTDGGRTWAKVLYINENTGFSDLAMDPTDSLVLYAASYEHRRLPYLYTSGGSGSGLYKTTDGGKTWRRLAKDLPEGLMGRIGLDVARSVSGVVYALIEHREPGIWRSDDQGESWKRMCDPETCRRVNTRPFYYSQIRVDPSNDKVVYVLSTGLNVSLDMGQKFRAIGGGIHSDHHALWIDPSNPLHLVEGNDGGIDISWDGGRAWLPVQSIDAAEVYQVGYDMRNPYYVYCGLQDNGSWAGPSATTDVSGITNDEWFSVGGGDGFFVKADPEDPNTIYSNFQMNNLSRTDLRILKSKSIRPAASLKEPPYRFNWNAPILLSPHDPKTIYAGGNFLFKSADRGNSWTIISPDLTTNNPKKQVDSGGPISMDNSGAEIHCTITTIAASPAEKDVIWCGTDDGLVHITRDGGKTWKNTTFAFPGLPANTWCSRLEASRFDAGTAYAAFDGHRQDDYAAYLFRTADYGQTWKQIKGNLPFGWVHVIREDVRNKNLLFAGTEFGAFASLDKGETWFSLKGSNFPTAAVHDIAIHPRENDLIIGTHGRGIWILDDISYLQEMAPEILNTDAYLFSTRPVTAFNLSAKRESFTKAPFSGVNPAFGAILTTYFKAKPKDRPKLSILNAAGDMYFESSLPTVEGIQRTLWNLQFVPKTGEGKRVPPSATAAALLPLAAGGDYIVELSAGGQKIEKKLHISDDPRLTFAEEERNKQQEALAELLVVSKKLGLAVTAATNIRRQIGVLEADINKSALPAEPVSTAWKAFSGDLAALEKEIIPKEIGSTRNSWADTLRGGQFAQLILMLGISISGFPSAPTEQEMMQIREILGAVDGLVGRLNGLIRESIPALNSVLQENKLKPLQPPAEIKD